MEPKTQPLMYFWRGAFGNLGEQTYDKKKERKESTVPAVFYPAPDHCRGNEVCRGMPRAEMPSRDAVSVEGNSRLGGLREHQG